MPNSTVGSRPASRLCKPRAKWEADLLFNSIEFALFFPLVVGVYFFLIPDRWRWAWLLLASCVFYMAFIPEYILILALTIVVDYVAALQIERARGRVRRLYLWASIVVTCLILFFFKYLDFVWQTGQDVRDWMGVTVTADDRAKFGFILPIGLSFHTFQSLSYVIEVYFGRQKAERHFGIYALYVLFFPQLVAGPIERPQHLLSQIRGQARFDLDRVTSGLRLMLWGMFLKTVVADRLAMPVDFVFSGVEQAPPDAIFLAAVFFAFQIYADFQGYTSIARGAARVLGFELIQNFDRPYASSSVAEFWRRWHMSLSSWFRDYVYIPLGGNRRGWARGFLNLMMTFMLSGLWHGANWTFVIWGAFNGAFVALERLLDSMVSGMDEPGPTWLARVISPIKILYAFSVILVGWVFFRASSVGEAWLALGKLPEGFLALIGRIARGEFLDFGFMEACGVEPRDLVLAVAAVAVLETIQLAERDRETMDWVRPLSAPLRFAAYATFLLAILYSWMYFPVSKKPFIYFQF